MQKKGIGFTLHWIFGWGWLQKLVLEAGGRLGKTAAPPHRYVKRKEKYRCYLGMIICLGVEKRRKQRKKKSDEKR